MQNHYQILKFCIYKLLIKKTKKYYPINEISLKHSISINLLLGLFDLINTSIHRLQNRYKNIYLPNL